MLSQRAVTINYVHQRVKEQGKLMMLEGNYYTKCRASKISQRLGHQLTYHT